MDESILNNYFKNNFYSIKKIGFAENKPIDFLNAKYVFDDNINIKIQVEDVDEPEQVEDVDEPEQVEDVDEPEQVEEPESKRDVEGGSSEAITYDVEGDDEIKLDKSILNKKIDYDFLLNEDIIKKNEEEEEEDDKYFSHNILNNSIISK